MLVEDSEFPVERRVFGEEALFVGGWEVECCDVLRREGEPVAFSPFAFHVEVVIVLVRERGGEELEVREHELLHQTKGAGPQRIAQRKSVLSLPLSNSQMRLSAIFCLKTFESLKLPMARQRPSRDSSCARNFRHVVYQ